ncbi:YbgF trimerization domain-containing protein [Acinetobacter sp.]|jgi:TolA-binding protein|uniref:YbgF trimerization domain-containing protein n=1 Tax=Acinetobacter sp. TaxID=472 RepID=UPI002839D359|nr:YbgF trimerization domain-containing protein [Acinetobacter sp.]MDR2249243.1 tetratricopeptide repeat protein [Acinetobacter sp.]
MQMKKHSLLFIALMSTTSLYANIPIESRGLSQNDGSASNTSSSNVSVPTNLNWELMQKNQQLENDVRTLRGQLEEQSNDIEQLKKDLANRYTDLDQRLELLHQKVDPDSASQEETTNTSTDSTNTPSASASQSTDNNKAAPIPTSTQQPATPVNNAQPATAQNQSNPLELEKAAYTVALDAYKQGGAKKAIAPMQNFIKNHPNSIYTGNAYFWLAEFHLATDPVNYNEAKKNYNIVANQYSNSSKAPRALYQLYSIAKDVDKNTVSANQYKSKLLTQYPKSEEAKFFKK